MTTPRIIIHEDKASLAKGAASLFLDSHDKAIKENNLFTAVLSGGNTPAALYEELSLERYSSRIDWSRVHLFWGDERCVGPEDHESNYHTAFISLISKIEIPQENIHRVMGELEPFRAAALYEQEIRDFFGLRKGEMPPFDLVLLGMGEDGHTLSVFPGTKALGESERIAVGNFVARLGTWRVTLTLPAVSKAKRIVFLVSGKEKAGVLKEVMDGKDLPAARVKGEDVIWLCDRDAALYLKGY